VKVDHDYGDINRVKNPDRIDAYRSRGRYLGPVVIKERDLGFARFGH